MQLVVQMDVKLWDITDSTTDCLHELKGHTGQVYSLAFSVNGTQLVSGSGDMTAKIWNVDTGELQQTLQHSDIVSTLSFSPDNSKLLSGRMIKR